jgi:AraC family transcriptional regulator
MTRHPGKITFGSVLRTVDVAGFILTETEHPPHFVLPRHDHACANLNFVLRGGVLETFAKQTADCGSLSVTVKPPGEAHANRYGPVRTRCLILETTSSRLEMLRPFTSFLDRPAFHQNSHLASLFLRIHKEFHASDPCAPLVVEGLILELLGMLGREEAAAETSSASPTWLNRVRERIHDQPHEVWTLSALAAAVGLHANYLARMFRKFYRCSVGEYARRLRLEHAARELAGTEKSLAQVAVESGFYDQSHFTHAFKRRFHMTPTAFRLAARTEGRLGTSQALER